MRKPRIRISSLSRCFVCSGLGISGSGWTMREAWECWKDEMIIKGWRSSIPY